MFVTIDIHEITDELHSSDQSHHCVADPAWCYYNINSNACTILYPKWVSEFYKH